MRKLFFILFALPLICFGKTTAIASADLSSYEGLIVGALAILSILLCVYLFLQLSSLRSKIEKLQFEDKVRRESEVLKKQRQEQEETLTNRNIDPERLNSISVQGSVLKDKPEKEGHGFLTLALWERAFDELNMRLLALEDPKLGKKLFEDVEPLVNSQQIIPEDVLQEQLFFAKLPSSDGGFNEEEFLSQQNGEQIYELKLKENEGTFTISETAQAQKYALTDISSYLGSACEFINQADRDSQIKTNIAGTVHKQGSQWLIIDKAKIEFV